MDNIENQQGNAIIELVVSLPFLFVLTFSIIDISQAMEQYELMTHAAREGARYATEVASLSDESEFYGLTGEQTCADDALTGTRRGSPRSEDAEYHEKIQDRVEELVMIQDPSLKAKSLCIRTGFASSVGLARSLRPGGGVDDDHTVYVRITGEYDSILPFFDGIKVSAEAAGPYLR